MAFASPLPNYAKLNLEALKAACALGGQVHTALQTTGAIQFAAGFQYKIEALKAKIGANEG